MRMLYVTALGASSMPKHFSPTRSLCGAEASYWSHALMKLSWDTCSVDVERMID